MRTLIVVILAVLIPGAACAHGAASDSSHAAWSFDPWVVLPLLASASLYVLGATALWRRAGYGRGIHSWQAAAYAGGLGLLAAALVSPLHQLGERLFTFHMIEHEVIMAMAAPLLAVARPIGAFLWALPQTVRVLLRRLSHGRTTTTFWRGLVQPTAATIIHGAAIWIWHLPALFDASVDIIAVHRLQHLSFLLTALLFWWALLRTRDYGVAAGHIFFTMLHTSILGALIALAPRVLYPLQTADAARWGLSSLQDQQLAGLVMWVPGGIIYAAAALACTALWIQRAGRHTGFAHLGHPTS